MCGRVHITKTIDEICHEHGLFMTEDQRKLLSSLPHFNLSPGMHLPLILQGNSRELFALHWGLIPFWAKSKQIGYKMINARTETILSKSAFKRPIINQRAVLFINGFYEWKKQEGGRQPYRIFSKTTSYLILACIHDRWDAGNGESIHSFSILTQAAEPPISGLHDRMPVLLTQDQKQDWLDPSSNAESLLADLTAPSLLEDVSFYPVSREVNKATHNSKELLNRVEAGPNSGDQLKLF